jgi:hypothetical protein
MGELIKGAQRLADLGRQQEAEAAARKVGTQAQQKEWAAMRPKADGRVRAFIGHLISHGTPTIALYEPQRRVRPRGPFLGDQIYISNYARVGDGWLALAEYRSWEEGTTPGIFIGKDDLAVVQCGEIKRGPLSGASDFNEKGEYVVATWGPNLDAPIDPDAPVIYAGPPLFATDEGKSILEAALVRFGVVS